jgi:hypothetical protein
MQRPTPPTIADLRADEGVVGAWVSCNGLGCVNHGTIAFDTMRAPPETPFIALARSGRCIIPVKTPTC